VRHKRGLSGHFGIVVIAGVLLCGAATLGLTQASASGRTAVADSDGDGVDDAVDNCPTAYNPDQRDYDQDGKGNRCDAEPFPSSYSEVIFYPRNANGVYNSLPDPGWCFHYEWSANANVSPHSGDA
jgi:hypothetical protein